MFISLIYHKGFKEYMFKNNINLMSPNFPVGIYSIPEVSMVGKNENQLIEENTP